MMTVQEWTEKLNKVDGNIHAVEEAVPVVGGVYEGMLRHDNVNVATFAVHTGPKLTGERLETYALSTPSLTPWKRSVRVYAETETVYLSYETDGDTVEAEDINRVQDAIKGTQEALNAEEARAAEAESGLARGLQAEERRAVGEEARLDGRVDDERDRAMAAEQSLSGAVSAEVNRAEGAEKQLADALAGERQRAESAERDLAGRIAAETARAEASEGNLEDGIAAESTRAEAAEKQNADNIKAETARAKEAEQTLASGLAEEAGRAKDAEEAITASLAGESARAKAAEKENKEAISAEAIRAQVKETELQGSIQSEKARAEAAETSIRGTIDTNKPVWDDKYTRNEVDNKFSALETSIDWKESVDTYGDILTAYPEPQDGWTVNTRDDNYTYRFNGSGWVAISANAIPKATQGVDGLLSKEDKANYDDAYGKRHTHGNKTAIDKITQAMLDNLGAAFSHISDAVRHISSEERASWDDAGSKKHTHTNKTVLDKVTQALFDSWSSAYAHMSDTVKHITSSERASWSTVTDKVDKVTGKGLSTNDYTTSEKNSLKKLADSSTPLFITDFDEFVPEINRRGDIQVVSANSNTPGSPVGNGLAGILMQTGTTYFTLMIYAAGSLNFWERYYANSKWSDWVRVTNSKDMDELTDLFSALLDGKVDKVSGKSLSTNDYSAAEKNKLAGIAAGAEVNVQADWNITDPASDAFIKNRPASMPASDVPAWAKAASKPVYAWTEINGKPGTFAPAAHTHSKSQITDMPTKVSQLANDVGYITQEDVDTSQNHTHANKTVLDKITQALVDKWNSALTAIPVHTHTKSQITDFPASLPANGGTANYANHLNANSLAANTDLNTVTVPGYYYCPANATAATLKNCPTTDAFFLETGKHAGVYQRLVEYITSSPKTFERNYYSGTWGAWKNITVLTPVPAGAKFTDTVYAHPNSGAAAGTYQRVTVNAQGHVTAGTNPTTLAGYGITDAAVKGHGHDGDYLKKGGLTWGDLKGV